MTYEEALIRASRTGSTPIPNFIYPCYVAETLGLNAWEMERLPAATVAVYMGYAEGKALAEWVRQKFHQGGNDLWR